MKPDLPKLSNLKTLRKRPSIQLAKQESTKSFTFTKPKDLFGQKVFLDVDASPDAVSRNLTPGNRQSNSKDKPRSFGGKSFGMKSNDKHASNAAAVVDLVGQDPQNQQTPEMTARFKDDNEAQKTASKTRKIEKKTNSGKKKSNKVVNRDRIKVNMLEDKIFQKENMLKDWLQNSKVIKKL